MGDGISGTLAEYLGAVLPTLDLRSGPDGDAPAGHLGEREPDLHLALLSELRHVVAGSPRLRAALADGAGRVEADELVQLVQEAVTADDGHSGEVLQLLLGGGSTTARPTDHPDRGRLARWSRTMVSNGWLARSVAAVWMNVLVLVAVALGFFTLWGGFTRQATAEDIALAALKIFALWCLSFLPGWLYIRFLGQRAGALWHEFVLHLHRLGVDDPPFLPRPPTSSEYFGPWLRNGGPLYSQQQNLYRQKFNAYYGRAVVEGVERTNFAVRVDTMFPVFLCTAVLTAGWSTVLWDTDFLTAPSSLWDVLRFAFLGAYAFVAQSLIRRYFQSDLRPSAYTAAVLRIVFVLLVVTALHQVLPADEGRMEAATAFIVGFFPIVALQALQRVAASVLRVVVPQLTPNYPLNQLDGLDIWVESRLLEEGIEDMQNLATANLVDVVLHTRVPVGRLVDWVDQAVLYVHLDRVERGWGELRLVRKERRLMHKERELAMAAARSPAPADPDDPPARDAAGRPVPADLAGGSPAEHQRVRGSVNPALRAGTQTRVALRQLGIRTATDVLKAFPPDQMDPTEDPGVPTGGRPPFRRLWPQGLDEDQIRTLVRVLDEDVQLAQVWNWQYGGVTARHEGRRPRTVRLPAPRPGPAEPMATPAPQGTSSGAG